MVEEAPKNNQGTYDETIVLSSKIIDF